jgi:hypothetical protein
MKIMRSFLAIAVMAAGVAAHAQNPGTWKVNIPFDFTVRHVNLEAGKYTVQQSGPIVILTSQDGKTANMLTNNEFLSKPSNRSSLTFRVSDGRYDLAQVRNAGSSTELDAIVSKHAPKRLEASIAPQTVEVAAVGTR